MVIQDLRPSKSKGRDNRNMFKDKSLLPILFHMLCFVHKTNIPQSGYQVDFCDYIFTRLLLQGIEVGNSQFSRMSSSREQ